MLHFSRLRERSGSPVRFVGLGLCLSFTIYFFLGHPPFTWPFLLLAAVLAYLRLEVAIALLPLTFPFFPYREPLSFNVYPEFSLEELGLFICLGVAMLRHLVRYEERRMTQAWLGQLWPQVRPVLPPALLFLLGASLALLVAPDLRTSLRAYRWEVIEPLLYFLLILRYLRTRTDLARAVGAFILAGLVAACFGIITGLFYITPYLDIVNASMYRIGGPYNNPNYLAIMLDRTIPLLLALAVLGVLRRPADSALSQRPAWRDPLRWLCLVLLIPLLWALYWTDSRGAEIAILVVVFCFFAYEIRSRLVTLAMAGAGILGLALFWPKVLAFLNEPTHGSASERLYIWKAALLMIRDHFLLGTGPDSFNTLYQPSAPNSYLLQVIGGQPYSKHFASVSHPHNFILEFWISTGVLGVVAIFWLLGAFVKVVVSTYRRAAALPQGHLLQRLSLGIAGCMLASVVHGLVDIMYFSPDLAMIFWLFLALVLVIRTIVQREEAALHEKVKSKGEEALAA